MSKLSKIQKLFHKGVKIPNPESVEIGDEVSTDRIAGNDVTLYSGTKIFGKETFIAEGVRIGYEGPATVVDCHVGPGVALKGGYFQEAVFLNKAVCGLGAHVRQGTILEEETSIAHTVGLKQTILFPYVTLGSLINFCDCLMAGGTNRTNHSEVGSSYIHFNYTPNQDKATPSLLGDVPRGVMLNQSPIFLGGQGGLVGPCRIAYGTVIAAGSICRKDQLKENHLVIEVPARSGRVPYKPGGFGNLKRIFGHNFNYIANLLALRQWYREIRSRFIGPEFPQQLSQGLIAVLEKAIHERIRQLERLNQKMQISTTQASELQKAFNQRWPQINQSMQQLHAYQGKDSQKEPFLSIIEQQIQTKGKSYLRAIRGLNKQQAGMGTQWLQSIVDHISDQLEADLS